MKAKLQKQIEASLRQERRQLENLRQQTWDSHGSGSSAATWVRQQKSAVAVQTKRVGDLEARHRSFLK